MFEAINDLYSFIAFVDVWAHSTPGFLFVAYNHGLGLRTVNNEAHDTGFIRSKQVPAHNNDIIGLIKFSYKTKTKREIGTYKDLMKPLPIVIQGDCLYAVKDKFLFLVYLRTGKMEKITVNEHKFITLVVYREEMYFFVRTATRRGKVIQIGIDFKTSFESSGFDIDRENGSAVAVNGIIYYFDGRVLEYRIERRESFTTHFRFKRLKNVIAIQDRIFGVDNKRDILEFIPTSYSNEVIWRSELHDIHICPIRNNSMF